MTLIDKIKNNAGKIALVGAVGLSSLLYTGCNTPESRRTGARMIGWGLRTGASNPDLTAQQQAGAYEAGRTIDNANRDEAIANSGTNVNININGGQNSLQNYPLIFTTKEKLPWDTNVGDEIKVFYPGEKVYMHGNISAYFPELPDGTRLANKNICLTNGSTDFCDKKHPVHKGSLIEANFDAGHLANNIGEGLYENIWYVEDKNGDYEQNGRKWKEIGRIKYIILKRAEKK